MRRGHRHRETDMTPPAFQEGSRRRTVTLSVDSLVYKQFAMFARADCEHISQRLDRVLSESNRKSRKMSENSALSSQSSQSSQGGATDSEKDNRHGDEAVTKRDGEAADSD